MVIQQPVGSPLADIIASAEGNRRMSRTMLYAIIAAGLLHAGLGYYLYKQHTSVPSLESEPPPTTTVDFYRPKPPPPPPQPKPEPTRTKTAPKPTTVDTHEPKTPPVTPTPTTTIPHGDPSPAGPITIKQEPPLPPGPPSPPAEPVKVAGPPIIVDPHWLSKPTAEQMQRAYPPRASTLEKTGRVTMQCSVLASGKVTGCAVTAEDPPSFGFGAAGLSLAKYFKMSPQTKDGQVIDGAKVNLRLAFTLQ